MKALNREITGVLGRDGLKLPLHTRLKLEARFGVSLKSIRLHIDFESSETARALNARAYTVGRHIVFQKGQYCPWSQEGMTLLIHEVVHSIQQGFRDPIGDFWAIDPEPRCEVQAILTSIGFATDIKMGHIPEPVIQRHPGPPCPSPPQWVEIRSLRPRTLWLPANQVIEEAYKDAHPNHSVLFGSQFGYYDIYLPRGTPDEALNNAILKHLRGLVRQRQPDIIDFTNRTIYEIKTIRYARNGRDQLTTLHQTIDAISRELGGPHWNPDLATWYPPHWLPLPGDTQNRIVCTADTEHNTTPTGLILYRVYRRTSPDEERQFRRRNVAVQELSQELRSSPPITRRLRNELERFARTKESGTELWIVTTPNLYQKIIRAQEVNRMKRTLDLMSVRMPSARRNPVIGFRNLGWTLVGASAAAMAGMKLTCTVVLAASSLIAGSAAVAAAGTAGGTSATTPGAEVILLAAARAAASAPATQAVARAAGVLIVVSTVKVAKAQTNKPTVLEVGHIRAILAEENLDNADYCLGRNIVHQGNRYRIAGRAIVR